jgi:ATP-binding cassette subfamily A (ABC1) protein 5
MFYNLIWLQTESLSGIDPVADSVKHSEDVESIDPSLLGSEAIKIRNIRKTYESWPSTKTVEAVKGISMDIYEGQITAILGRLENSI